jgi:hypothetical protein
MVTNGAIRTTIDAITSISGRPRFATEPCQHGLDLRKREVPPRGLGTPTHGLGTVPSTPTLASTSNGAPPPAV